MKTIKIFLASSEELSIERNGCLLEKVEELDPYFLVHSQSFLHEYLLREKLINK